ncbi:aldo/keto reductase [bacterium]|nr:aldo/keto reductase [bacterium]
MQKKRLGNTELYLSNIGLGTWALGGGGYAYGWGSQDDKESVSTIWQALDSGINWIDTAPVYGLGHAEKIVGKALKGHKEVLIASKCGLIWNEKRKISGCLKRVSIRREIEASLRRLKRDTIDLYQIHWPDPDEDIEEAWSFMMDLIKEGKIRYAGVSNFDLNQLKRLQSIYAIGSLQPPYSMLMRDLEKEVLDYCADNHIGLIVYSPLESGLLTGKFTKDKIANLPNDDWRKKKNSHFQEPELSINLKLLENLRPLIKKNGRTMAQMAIAWTLRRSEVTAAIVGARHPAQIKETVVAGEKVLSPEEIDYIETLLKERAKTIKKEII